MTEERTALSSLWLRRANEAYHRYTEAKAVRVESQEDVPHLAKPDGNFSFRRAVVVEIEALMAWQQALKMHYNIVVKGERPTE